MRKLNKTIIAPVNNKWHTYQLLWGPHDRYEVKIDDQTALKGSISKDFISQAEIDYAVKPNDW